MAENNSIDNLDRQDLLTVLGGFIKQTEQINEIEDKRKSRFREIAKELLLTKYKEPKNLVIAYFLAPFYVLKGKKLKQQTSFETAYQVAGWLFGLVGLYVPFGIINSVIDLFTGNFATNGDLGGLLVCIPMGIIGYFMGRKEYKYRWFDKVIKKGNYNDEIRAVAYSDPQYIDYKNKQTSLVNDATYQQYLSLIPQNFTFSDIVGIYQMLLDYRADNFKEAVNAWRQEQHNKRVENKMNENTKKISQMDATVADLAKRQDKAEDEMASTEAAIVSTLAQTKQATEMAQAASDQAASASAQAAGANAQAARANAQAARKAEGSNNRIDNLKRRNGLRE